MQAAEVVWGLRMYILPRRLLAVAIAGLLLLGAHHWWHTRLMPSPGWLDDPHLLYDEDERPAVLIDPGHGGVDGGARGHGLLEKDVVLSISLLLRDALLDAGVPAELTRDTDKELSPKKDGRTFYRERHVIDLQNRLDYARDLGAWALVSIHANSSEVDYAKGQLVIYQADNLVSERLALALCQELSAYGRCQTRVEDAFLLRDEAMPAVLVEVGYLTNPPEAAQLGTEAYRQALAEAIARAITMVWHAR